MSERAKASPDRPQDSFKSLKMLLLEGGKAVPPVVFEKTGLTYGSLAWSSGGQSLLVRHDRTIETFDPASGQRQDTFFLPFPQGQAPRPPRGNLPLPPPVSNQNDQPMDWYEPYLTLSADGRRLAAHLVHQTDNPPSRENYVVFWDVASRRVLGSLRLADESFPASGDSNRPAAYNSMMGYTAIRIALSGDGRKLAVSDILGAVRVYDVSRISGVSKVKPGNAPPGDAKPASHADVKSVRESYESAVAKARERLLEGFDEWTQKLEKNADAGNGTAAQVLARLKGEKATFEKHGQIPWSEQMRGRTSG